MGPGRATSASQGRSGSMQTCERKESCDACLRRLHELWNDLLRLTPNDDLGPFEVRAREVEEAIAACLERPTVTMDLGAPVPHRDEGVRRPALPGARGTGGGSGVAG